jgi:hypothetical protein
MRTMSRGCIDHEFWKTQEAARLAPSGVLSARPAEKCEGTFSAGRRSSRVLRASRFASLRGTVRSARTTAAEARMIRPPLPARTLLRLRLRR